MVKLLEWREDNLKWKYVSCDVDADFWQKGMWAMIGTSIALVIWTSGLLYMTTTAENKRVTEAQVGAGDEKNFEADVSGDAKV